MNVDIIGLIIFGLIDYVIGLLIGIHIGRRH